ncbi:hypothetical protein Tco_0729667 [Tanacetum coccineum]|uniref:Retrotransposon gag domain-containing protein n=1 Tax=Tanacetum coccineum TaxID=301880 RepID=A0ABQ4YRY3_9ASTR
MTGREPSTTLNEIRNEGTSNHNTTNQIIIKGHLSVLRELLKEPRNRDLIKPMLLNFNDDAKDTDEEVEKIIKKKGKEKSVTEDTKDKKKSMVGDEDLTKPFKEVLKCPFTRRIIKFSSPRHMLPANAKIYDDIGDLEDHITRFTGMGNQGEWPMPVWCWMFQQDGKTRAWFDKFPLGSINNWGDLQEKFLNRFGNA